MALVLNDIIRVAHFCWKPPQQSVNVLYYQIGPATGGIPTEQDLADIMHGIWGNLYKAWMPTVASYLGCQLQKVSPTPIGALIQSAGTVIPGVLAQDALPTQTAFVISWKSALGGSSYRGRTYLPFFTEGNNDAQGKPTSDAIAAVTPWQAQTQGHVFVGTGGDNFLTLDQQLYSRKLNGYNAVITGTRRLNWGTIRRRSQIGKSDTPIR